MGWVSCSVTLLSATLLLCSCDPEGLGRPNPDFLVIGHRGAPRIAPENTIPAFEVATVLGANAIELDVCVTQDGVFVIWHDRDPDDAVALARQMGVEGLAFVPAVPDVGTEWRRPVEQLTLAELRAHYGYAELGGDINEVAVIPTFAEGLDWARDQPGVKALYVDVKLAANQTASARALVWELDAALVGLDHVRFYLLSIHRSVVDALRQEVGEHQQIRVAHDIEGLGALGATLEAGLRDVSMGLVPKVTWGDFKEEVADIVSAREAGLVDSVTVWTFDREMQLAELLYYSVDGVMTNDPEKLYAIWQDTLE